MHEIKVTNLVKFYTVLLLADGSKTGYEIIKKTTDQMGRKTSPGQIYPFLKSLEKAGYLASKEPGSRDRIVYALTPEGRKFVRHMLSRFGDLIDIAIEPRLSLCAHCGCKVYEGEHKETINKKVYTFCCPHCARAFMQEGHSH